MSTTKPKTGPAVKAYFKALVNKTPDGKEKLITLLTASKTMTDNQLEEATSSNGDRQELLDFFTGTFARMTLEDATELKKVASGSLYIVTEADLEGCLKKGIEMASSAKAASKDKKMCSATTKTGTPCKCAAKEGFDFCGTHNKPIATST